MRFLQISIMLTIGWTMHAQDDVTKVVYGISSIRNGTMVATQEAQQAYTITMEWMGDMRRQVVKMGDAFTSTVTYDTKAKKGLMLLETMGKNYAIPLTEKEKEYALGNGFQTNDLEEVDSTVTVMDHNCTGVTTTHEMPAYGNKETEELIYTYWVTEDFTCAGEEFDGIDGFPLRIDFGKEGNMTVYEAIEISSDFVEIDVSMEIPKGYKERTWEEHQKKSGLRM